MMITGRSRCVGVLLLLLGLIGIACDHPLPTEKKFDSDIQFGMNAFCRVDVPTSGWMLNVSMFDSIPSNGLIYIYDGDIIIQGTRTTTDNGVLTNPRYLESFDSILTIRLATADGAEYVATSPMTKAVTTYVFSPASRSSGMTITIPRPLVGGEQLVATVYRNIPGGWSAAYKDSTSVAGTTSLLIPSDVVRSNTWLGGLRVGAQITGRFLSSGFPAGATFTWQHKDVIDTVEVVQ